jgi:predicted PurR-regulated permease PerM
LTAAPPAASVRARRARFVIAILALGVGWASLPFLAGLLGAVVLAVLDAPLQRRLAPRIGVRRAALLLTIGTALLLVAPAALVLVAFIRQAPILLTRALESDAFSRLAELQLGPLDVGEQLAGAGRGLVAWISARWVMIAGGLTRALLNLLLAVVGLYYLLPAGPALWRRLRGFIPFSAEGTDLIAARFASITEAALLGIIATGITQGLTVGLAFLIVGLPNPAFWGAVTGLVSVLPILGSAIVWVPGAIVLALSGRPIAAVVLALIGVVIASNIDNVVRPVIYRRVSGLHPMASLLGAFAGVELLGLLGLVLGPLAVAYCMELVRLYEVEYGVSA